MVAAGNRLFVAAGGDCIELDAQTGTRTRTFSVPFDTEKGYEWGYIAVVGDTLVGSVTRPLATVRVQLAESSGQVCSDSLFAIDLPSGRRLWDYAPPGGVIINPAIAIGSGRVYLVESANPETRNDADGRMELPELVGKGSRVVALNLKSGQPVWQHPARLEALQTAIYLSCSQDTLALTGSKVVTLEGIPRMRYDVRAYDAASGDVLWQSDHAGVNDQDPGDHGNDRQHPAIVGTTLYGSNFACDLRTGKTIEGWKWKKSHKCATLSASAHCAFSRFTDAKTPHVFDFRTGEQASLTSITRPGCWINTIPAGGLVLIPEASSGCTCPYPVQTSLALAPRG
jgi:outer membrane protein assembly factor BamB